MMITTYYNEFFGKGQQKIYFDLYQLGLPDDDPVYTLIKVLEDLNFENLIDQCSHKGRKGYNPIMMYAIIQYARMNGTRSVDQIVELCKRDLGFIWLAKGAKPCRDAFYDFINNKLTNPVLEDLHYQFIRRLYHEGYVTLAELFNDGTKIEANANRYTFVWRGSINYHLANLLDSIDSLFTKYNDLLEQNDYGSKYQLLPAKMFIISGMDKVKETIAKNRARKLTTHKKIPNNTIITIENSSPLELLKLQQNLVQIAENERIEFVYEKGGHKSDLQKLHEELEECGNRLIKYKNHFEILGEDRNSYSKTDLEATFMRMKDDHMMNGQLKPGYNVQVAVENYFVIHSHVSNDRTDYDTLIPILEKHKKAFGHYPSEITADSGYSSEKNLSFLKENEIVGYIKLQSHEQMKTRAYKNNIGSHSNMTYHTDEEGRYYLCHDGRKLRFTKTEKNSRGGPNSQRDVYSCNDCSGCIHKSKCLYKYDENKHVNKNKVMKVNHYWEELKAESHKNIQSERGIRNRQIRSVQTEGHFGDIKENNDFRKFNYRTTEKVSKEFLLFAMGRNLMKYHRFIHGEIKKFEPKIDQQVA